MRNLEDVCLDLQNAFDVVIDVINKEKEYGEEKYLRLFNDAIEKENMIKLEMKELVINGYAGHEKFSQEVLDSIYANSLLLLNEWCTPLTELPKSFATAMRVIEKAYQDGVNSTLKG